MDMLYVNKPCGVFKRRHGVTEFEGAGIGLLIVNRYGGRVSAQGKVNEGTTGLVVCCFR
jgi:light-regulated signal transduction histidine kinase (bacteriophytochrome)